MFLPFTRSTFTFPIQQLINAELFDRWVNALADNDNAPGDGGAKCPYVEPVPEGLLTFY
jgi:hypothetical protein